MPTLTIFTPTYNRKHTLIRTFQSLQKQTCKDFEWLIVDDGSKDNTAELVERWKHEAEGFQIRYIYKENGGMHTAHNVAYVAINTELNVCIDSDDAMPENAVQMILEFWKKHKAKGIGGIVALDSDFEGKIIGNELPAGVEKASTEKLASYYHITGDKKYIYRTSVMKEIVAYPEFPGEKLVPLSYKYLLAAQKYDMLLMNEVVCLVDYQPDGSTNTIYKQYLQSPRGFAAQNAIRMQYSTSWITRVKSVIHYIADHRIARDGKCLKDSPRKLMTILLYPFGMMFQQHIYYVNRKMKKC